VYLNNVCGMLHIPVACFTSQWHVLHPSFNAPCYQ